MGSTNFTEHYDIPLPLGSDKTTPMDYNPSMQAIDTALFTAQSDASDAKTGLATTNQNVAQNAQDIGTLAGRVTAVEGTVSSQGTAITNLGTKVDGVEQDAQDMICAYNEASATASRNYAVGDYFIYNDVLYRATQAITAGGTIVPDTNCTTTNVTSEIKNFSPDLSAYQTKQDNDLETTSKEVVGAINEVNSALPSKVTTQNVITGESGVTIVGSVARKYGDVIAISATITTSATVSTAVKFATVSNGFRPPANVAVTLANQSTGSTSHNAYVRSDGGICAGDSLNAGTYSMMVTYII